MRALFLAILSCFLFACATTPAPRFTKQQDQESAALAILESYTTEILAAAALPLQDYCHGHVWPDPKTLDTTQPLLSNLLGLYYLPINAGLYEADFGLIDASTGVMTSWKILIPKINAADKGVQKVKLEIINNNLSIHLLNVMDFQCQVT